MSLSLVFRVWGLGRRKENQREHSGQRFGLEPFALHNKTHAGRSNAALGSRDLTADVTSAMVLSVLSPPCLRPPRPTKQIYAILRRSFFILLSLDFSGPPPTRW